MEMVAFYMDKPYSFVEEGMLDADVHINLLESFFTVGGCQAIVFNETSLNHPGKYTSVWHALNLHFPSFWIYMYYVSLFYQYLLLKYLNFLEAKP